MKNARSLTGSVALTFVLAISALAGEIPTPPGSSCTPGQIDTPPCVLAQSQNSGETGTPTAALAPGEIDTPPVGAVSLTEIASFALLSIMSLF
jgi:hypothetical protein